MKLAKRKQIFNEINITPLTDIFLVLLIIMMVVAPMLDTKGLKLAVPTVSQSQDVTEDPKTIELVIAQNGTYTIGGNMVTPFLLSTRLREMKTEQPDGVVIKANPDATHEVLTYAMDAAQAAGIHKVAVVSDVPEADEPIAGQ